MVDPSATLGGGIRRFSLRGHACGCVWCTVYNVRQILQGDFAPSVQISVHPMDSGGLIELVPLLESENTIIREGIAALLTEKVRKLRQGSHQSKSHGWTGFQWADKRLTERLELMETEGKLHEDQAKSAEAFETFRKYAYQWY